MSHGTFFNFRSFKKKLFENPCLDTSTKSKLNLTFFVLNRYICYVCYKKIISGNHNRINNSEIILNIKCSKWQNVILTWFNSLWILVRFALINLNNLCLKKDHFYQFYKKCSRISYTYELPQQIERVKLNSTKNNILIFAS